MAKIAVKIDSLSGISDKSKQISGSIGNIEASFSSIIKSLDWDIASAAGIQTTANQISKNVTDCETSTANLATFLLKAQSEYSILDGLEVPEGFGDGLGEVSEGSSFWGDWGSDILKLISSFGPSGTVVSSLLSWIFDLSNEKKSNIEKILSTLKASGKITGAILKYESLTKALSTLGSTPAWKTALGFVADPSYTVGATNFTENLSKAWSKTVGTDVTKASSWVKWGGYVVQIGSNAVGNVKEYQSGEISAGRAVTETVTESVIGIGAGILVGTAVTAIAGTIGAPIVVAGAVTALIGIGAEAIYQNVGDGEKKSSLTEAVSDGLIDGVLSIGEQISTGIGKIGNAISSWNPTAKWSFA